MRQPVLVRRGGELDSANAPEWGKSLAVAVGNDVILDLADVTLADSMFLDAVFQLVNGGQGVTIVGCPPSVARC